MLTSVIVTITWLSLPSFAIANGNHYFTITEAAAFPIQFLSKIRQLRLLVFYPKNK